MQLVNTSQVECNKIIKSLIKMSVYVQISLQKQYMLFGTWRVPYIVLKLIWTYFNIHNIVQKRNAHQSTIELRLTPKTTFPLLCVWITKLWPIHVLNLHHLLLKLMFSLCIIHMAINKQNCYWYLVILHVPRTSKEDNLKLHNVDLWRAYLIFNTKIFVQSSSSYLRSSIMCMKSLDRHQQFYSTILLLSSLTTFIL